MIKQGDWGGHHSGHPHPQQTSSVTGPPTNGSNLESLIQSLVVRLDENDRRYGAALNDLHGRLDAMASRAGTAAPPESDGTGDILRGLEAQAATLAERVREADQVHRSQQPSDTRRAVEDHIGQFTSRMQADETAEIERSLAAVSPVAELERLSTRIDQLSQRLDVALGERNDTAALTAIETQLANLSAQFQRDLDDLNNRSRELGGRTVSTLESMNATLLALTGQIAAGAADAAPPRPEPAPPSRPAPAEGLAAPAPVPRAEAQPAPAPEAPPFSAARDSVGASIPDYQDPAALRQPVPRQTAPSDPAASDDGDFLASARRAAQAAAVRPLADAGGKGLFSRFRRGPTQAPAPAPTPAPTPSAQGKKPRPVIVGFAVLMLALSAVLLYGRLKSKDTHPVAQSPAATEPASPSRSRVDRVAPKAPSSKDGAQLLSREKKTSRHGTRQAPLAADRSAKAGPPSGGHTPAAAPAAPRPNRSLAADRSADATAPKLASLPALPIEPNYPGLAVTIMEPPSAPAGRQPQLKDGGTSEPTAPRLRPQTPQMPQAPRTPRTRKPTAPMPPVAIGPQSLRLAAAKGAPQAQFEVAQRYAQGRGVARDFTKAAEWYARAAAQGLAPAQYRLAALSERGRGLKKDLGVARIWYERAAAQGNVKAMHNLAVTYTGAAGRAADHAKAAKWFAMAARHGLADSQFNLAILYESGLGLQKSYARAYQWFGLAAARGDRQAAQRQRQVKAKLRPEALRTADRAIQLWRAKPRSQAANEVRPPKGGWRSVAAPNQGPAQTIARAQSLLNKLGYDAGMPDGVMGPKTAGAIRRFETRNGLSVTGQVSRKLVSRLEAMTG